MKKKVAKLSVTETKTEKVGIATKFLKEKVIEFLTEIPIAKYAYGKAGVPKSTYYKWRQIDKDFLKTSDEAIMHGKISINELAKSQLIKMIQKENITAIIFWLKHNDPDFNPRIAIDIKREESFDPEQIKMIVTAFRRIGISNTEAAEALRKIEFLKSRNKLKPFSYIPK